MKKKEYERPQTHVVELRVMNQLLAGSFSTSFEGYQDGSFVWAREDDFQYFDLDE